MAATILSAKFIACELRVERVGTFGGVLYRNQWPINFILHFREFHNDSSIRYKITLFENYIHKCYIVKRIIISFNCFSEYIYIIVVINVTLYHLELSHFLKGICSLLQLSKSIWSLSQACRTQQIRQRLTCLVETQTRLTVCHKMRYNTAIWLFMHKTYKKCIYDVRRMRSVIA